MNATLDTNFSEGDIFTAGVVSSTSSLNGITTTINSNTVTKLIYAGTWSTTSSVVNTTSERTIGTITIPANTVDTGIIITSTVGLEADANSNRGTFKLKTGTVGSETQRMSVDLGNVASLRGMGALNWYDDASTFTSDVGVIVTGTNSHAGANSKCTCYSIVVLGY